jgi:hypothetical protein
MNKATEELLLALNNTSFSMIDATHHGGWGADLNCKTNDGEYLLFYLLKRENFGDLATSIENLIELSEQGMDLTKKDKEGNGIFCYFPDPTAVEFWPEGYDELEERITGEDYLAYVELKRIVNDWDEDLMKLFYPSLYPCDEEE